MSIQKINPRFAVLAIFMIAVAAMRIPNAAQLTPWSNFSPIGAMALFGGAYFSKNWKLVAFPLLTLFISDIVINVFVHQGKYGVMYSGWYWIYLIFILISYLGKLFIKKVTFTNILIAGVTASLAHWLIADFLVWIGGGTDLRTMQPLSKDFAGLMQCYLQGFPFMKNFMAGTLLYSCMMFGIVEWMYAKKSSLQTA